MRSIHSAAATCLRARSARGIWRVGDVADECMPERVLGLVLDRRHARRSHELLARQAHAGPSAPRPSSRSSIAATRTGPEDLADHGCVVKQRFALRGQRVEAGGDQAPGPCLGRGCRSATNSPPSVITALVGQHPDELLRVERVSAGLLEESACVSAGRTACSRSAARSCAVSSAPSGDSEIVFEFRLPPPQPGWLS